MAPISAVAALANVEPVSPSPDLASRVFRSSCDEMSTRQQLVKNVFVGSVYRVPGSDNETATF